MSNSTMAGPVDRLYKATKLGDNNTRLLKLHPGSKPEPLFGNLLRRKITRNRSHIEANSNCTKDTSDGSSVEPDPFAEEYLALSYTWGPAATTGNEKYIKIIAEDESYSISIKPNLHAALVRFRETKHYTFLWIDALCINQSDNKEKSAQIPRMPEIYHGAAKVCIWLGEEKENSTTAMSFIEHCFAIDDFDGLFNSEHSEEWNAVFTLMRRPWFSRRWIVQELARARKAELYCGDHNPISWQDFADIISLMSSRQEDMKQIFRQSRAFHNHPDFIGDLRELAAVKLIRVVENAFRKNNDGQIVENAGLLSLEALMSSLSAFEASDPRDILYAILWLANDAEPATKDKNRKFKSWADGTNGRATMPIKADQLTPYFEKALYDLVPVQTPSGRSSPSRTASRSGSLVKPRQLHVRPRSNSVNILGDSQVASPGDIGRDNPLESPARWMGEQEDSMKSTDEAPRPLTSHVNGSQVHGNSNSIELNGNAAQAIEHSHHNNGTALHSENNSTLNDTKGPASIEPKRLSVSEPRPPPEHRQSLGAVAVADHPIMRRKSLRLSSIPQWASSSASELAPDIRITIPSETEEDKRRRAFGLFKSRVRGKKADKQIVVDYEKNFFQVCRDFLKFSLRTSQSLDMMLYPWAPAHPAHERGGHNTVQEENERTGKGEALPSWIPTLSHKPFALDYEGAHRRINADPLVGTPGHGHKSYNASLSRLPTYAWDEEDPTTIRVKGFILDRVAWKGSPAMEGIIPSDWVEAAGWKNTDDLPPDEFWRSLVGGLDAHGQRPPYHWKRTCRDAFRRRQSFGDLDTKQIITHGCPSHINEFLKRVQCVVWKRRLFGLRRLSDAFGIGSRHVKKGDLICILYGCSVPVILRRYEGDKPMSKDKIMPTNDDKENVTYRLIGECYVYGMMNGEAFRHKDKWDFPQWVRNFKLK